jgi:hypothetical protein
MGMAVVAFAEGNYAEAYALYRDALAIFRELGEKWHMAARLWGAAEAFRESFDAPIWQVLRANQERMTSAVGVQLGEEEFATAWAEGRAMTLEQVFATLEQTSLLMSWHRNSVVPTSNYCGSILPRWMIQHFMHI